MKNMNIVIVMTDQQRHDLRRGAGCGIDTMPNLDRWAAGGADFGRAYTSNPTCMPARVSMLTGRYSQSHRVRTNHNLADALYSEDLLDVLKKLGYRTALCGKNHSHLAPGAFDRCDLYGHLGSEGGQRLSPEEREYEDFLRSTDFIDSDTPSPGGVAVQLPKRIVDSALDFVDSAEGRPFFAWVSFPEPHNPYQAPAPYFDLFPPSSLPPESGSGALPRKGRRFEWIGKIWERVLGPGMERRILRDRSNYLGMLRLLDDQFGRLIEGLRLRGVLDDTLVVFLSDHGDFAGRYGLMRKGPDLPDVLCRIPMVWRGPGVLAQGRNERDYVSIVDVLPTICDLLGVPIPFGVQGKSIAKLLDRTESGSREFACAYAESGFSGLYWNEEDGLTPQAEGACRAWETFDCLNTWTQSGQVRMLCKDGWKIQVDMLGAGFLYDLAADPGELNDLWNEEACAAKKGELLTELAAAMMRNTDALPAPRNRYRTKVHPKGYWFDRGWRATDPGVRDIPPRGDAAKK